MDRFGLLEDTGLPTGKPLFPFIVVCFNRAWAGPSGSQRTDWASGGVANACACSLDGSCLV